jgi:outer membrane lipoprotein-sorting protein
MHKLSVVLAAASSLFAQTTEQTYKNITALKGTPADQLMSTMQFISASLGVECSACHVQGSFESDDKAAKKTAREMIAMQNAINKDAFHGRLQVTCNTCHRGSLRPVSVPNVSDGSTPPAAAPPAANTQVTVEQILDKYVTALGGAEAIQKVTSRIMKGTQSAANQSGTPIEVLTKAPNKRVTIAHLGNTDSFTAFDGTAGWMGSTGRTARAMSAADSAGYAIDGEFYFPLRIKSVFPQLRRGRIEAVNGVECEVLNGSAPGKPAVRLYFDKNTGLLTRLVRFTDTPLGRMPVQIDYADYKTFADVKIPLRWTLSRPSGRFTIQIDDVKINASIDDARFAKPEGEIK